MDNDSRRYPVSLVLLSKAAYQQLARILLSKDFVRPFLVITVAYLLGSIPFGYLIVRATAGADVRETGSGGTGATNVSRRVGKAAGVVTLLLDTLKGMAAVLIASYVVNGQVRGVVSWWIAGASAAVIVGHMFPVWLGFRGGKGVATGVGVLLVLAPIALVAAGLVFIAIVWFTRYVSLGSIATSAAIPILIWIQNYFYPNENFLPLFTGAFVIALLIILAHRANIGRLINGTESKFV